MLSRTSFARAPHVRVLTGFLQPPMPTLIAYRRSWQDLASVEILPKVVQNIPVSQTAAALGALQITAFAHADPARQVTFLGST